MVLQGSGRGEEATKKPLAKAPASQAIFRRPEGMRSLLQVRRGSKAQARASTPSPPQLPSEHSLTFYPGPCCSCTAHEGGLEAQPRRSRGAGKLGSRSRFIALKLPLSICTCTNQHKRCRCAPQCSPHLCRACRPSYGHVRRPRQPFGVAHSAEVRPIWFTTVLTIIIICIVCVRAVVCVCVCVCVGVMHVTAVHRV